MKCFQTTPDTKHERGQRGFALIEVLASLLILTVGLLSVAGLSINSLKASDTSAHRARAAREVIAISDAIRSNRQAAADDEFNVGSAPSDVPATSNAAIIKAVSEWKAALGQIPGGEGAIAYDEARDTIVITASWNEARTGDASREYKLEIRL
jgi:type IV pilus assembly protein PilV